ISLSAQQLVHQQTQHTEIAGSRFTSRNRWNRARRNAASCTGLEPFETRENLAPEINWTLGSFRRIFFHHSLDEFDDTGRKPIQRSHRKRLVQMLTHDL